MQAKPDELIAYLWVEWPSKGARDAAWPKLMKDERMQPGTDGMPFDGPRMIDGEFAPIIDE